MRRTADRVDRSGAPKWTGMSFYFKEPLGVMIDSQGRQGCRLWYLGDDEYAKAHQVAD